MAFFYFSASEPKETDLFICVFLCLFVLHLKAGKKCTDYIFMLPPLFFF